MQRDKISNEKIIAAFDKHEGVIKYAAAQLGITPKTLRIWVKEDKELQEAAQEARECLKDLIEGALVKKIRKGDTACIIFAAKTIAKDRGYVERQEFAEHIEQQMFADDDDDDPTVFDDENIIYNNTKE